MWVSDTMTTWESFITFLVGFSIVFICLLSLALFIVISSKVVGAIAKDTDKPKVNTTASPSVSSKASATKTNEAETEELAVIISAVSEEMRTPIDKFQIVSVKQI